MEPVIVHEGVSVYHGNSRTVLQQLPARSIQTCITSPPYYGLRNYGAEGQFGLEATPEAYVANLVDLFREVRRVLRDDGTLWLNLGDSYCTRSVQRADGKRSVIKNYAGAVTLPKWREYAANGHARYSSHLKASGLKDKDLIGIPWMVAFALRADGWYLRSDIIWSKTNGMPESVKDRPARNHEYLFLLTKCPRYYYDIDATREPHTTLDRPPGTTSRVYVNRDPMHAATNKQHPSQVKSFHPLGKNKRSVWSLATQPYRGAHFATFPEKLIEPCVLAGSSPQACEFCGAPWKRQTERIFHPQEDVQDPAKLAKGSGKGLDASSGWAKTPRGWTEYRTIGWVATCRCATSGHGQTTVLDPFAGSGTVGQVARRHGRNAVLIELGEHYLPLIAERIAR